VFDVVLLWISFAALVLGLGKAPPVWFDEGWTLSLVRNWIELGHYGHLLAGNQVPATSLSLGFSAIAPIALSCRMLGLGVWQARLPSVYFTFGALVLLYSIGHRLYGRQIARASFASSLLLSAHPDIHALHIGRQVLGEPAALFYLLLGYVALLVPWDALTRTLAASLAWGLALQAKPQILPFLVVSVVSSVLIELARGRQLDKGFIVALIGALAVSAVVRLGEQVFLGGGNDPYGLVWNVSNFATLVATLSPWARYRALSTVVLFLTGLPQLLGTLRAARQMVQCKRFTRWAYDCAECVHVSLLALVVVWYGWFLIFSVGWPRYLFPAAFVGNLFLARLLHRVTHGFDLTATLSAGSLIFRHPFDFTALRLTAVLLLLACTCLWTVLLLWGWSWHSSDTSARQVADYLNSVAGPAQLVETYEVELFFFLDRPYHYPSFSVQPTLNRRTFLGEEVAIPYDPMSVRPSYLVVGPMGRLWQLYARTLDAGGWQLVLDVGRYQVYRWIP